MIGLRLRRLSEDSQRALTYASVLGREFSLDALTRLTGFQEGALLDALDEAMAARIVGDVPGVPGRVSFAHVLIRDTLYEDLTPARRLRLHREAGGVIETLYANRLESHLAELAYHFAEAAPAGDADKAVGYAWQAGDRAAGLLAFEEAARLYRLALKLTEVDDLAGRRRRCRLLVALGDVQARAGDMPAARESFLHAAELAGAVGSGELLARAALGYGGRFVFTRATDDHRVVPLLEQAAEALGEENPLRVRVLTRLANAREPNVLESSDALSAEALETARRLDDPATLAFAISGRLWATRGPTALDERWALTSELIQANDKERVFEGHAIRTIIRMARGDVPGVRQEFQVMGQLAAELNQPAQHWWMAAHGATLALLEGRLGDAETFIERARERGERAQRYDALTYYQIQRFALRREQGRLAETLSDLERAAEADPGRPLLRCTLAVAYHELGRAADALRVYGELAGADFGALAVNNDWLLSAALLAEVAASADDADSADVLYRRLIPFDGLNVDTYEVSTGAVARYLGLLARRTARLEEARHHFETAIAMNERMGARLWLAHTQRDYARLLLARNGRGDRPRAAELLKEARATYRDLGMTEHSAIVA